MSEPTPKLKKKAKKSLQELADKTTTQVKQEPVKSVVWAFFIGILITVFPLGRIVSGVTSLALSLLRPLLLVLGVLKLWEEIDDRRSK